MNLDLSLFIDSRKENIQDPKLFNYISSLERELNEMSIEISNPDLLSEDNKLPF
jgi:hypothetical protein